MNYLLAASASHATVGTGLLLGILFGFLLQRGGVASYDVIVNQFRLKDFTVMKIMMTAIIVGGLGITFMTGRGLAEFEIKSADMLAVIIGAALFGIGMVLYGYCPGTGVAAIGTGSIHALVGVIGMVVGGAIYAFAYPWIAKNILPVGSLGKIRLTDISSLSAWVWFAILIAFSIPFFLWLENRNKKTVPLNK